MIDFKNYYQAPQISDWQGRPTTSSDDYFYQMIELVDLAKPLKKLKPGFALLGFASDIGVRRNLGRPGAAAGSQAIKQALASLAVQQPLVLYDVGTIVPKEEDLESAQTALAEVTYLLLQNKITPLILGGGHETAWGHYQGIAKFLGDKPLSIINFDAHFDLRDIPADQKGTSGTPFRQIAADRSAKKLGFDYTCLGIQSQSNTQHLFQVAEKLGVNYLSAQDMCVQDSKFSADFLERILKKTEHIYLSLCLDVFSVAYAPAVSAPQVLGLSPWQVIPLIQQIVASNKLVSVDIVELAPVYDTDLRTRKLAASLLTEVVYCSSLL